jgi:uncharacterized protein YukE
MSDIIELNYPAMEEMAQHCKAVAQRLLETARLSQSIAQQMNNGALVGNSGEAFAGALNTALSPSVTRLSQKFDEVAKSIEAAIQDMRTADESKTTTLFHK